MHLDVPENKRLKIETEQYNSDDDFSDYIKGGNPEVDAEKKKRRGKIEKRRRDRINNSLTELKELVPSAVAKQNTTKLEKAEILKLTVDYLKELKNPSRFFNGASHMYESRLMGFRDCLNEISKYLLHREGMSNQNPLYQGLMEHLQYCYQCYATQVSYQQDGSLPIDPSQRYSQMQSSFGAFDPSSTQISIDGYQKVPQWVGSMQPQYPNNNNNNNVLYPNNPLQSSSFSVPRNSTQSSSQYDLNVPNTLSSTLVGEGNALYSMFKFSSSAGSVHNLSSPQPSLSSPFNSFCHAPNNYFHNASNNSTTDSMV